MLYITGNKGVSKAKDLLSLFSSLLFHSYMKHTDSGCSPREDFHLGKQGDSTVCVYKKQREDLLRLLQFIMRNCLVNSYVKIFAAQKTNRKFSSFFP